MKQLATAFRLQILYRPLNKGAQILMVNIVLGSKRTLFFFTPAFQEDAKNERLSDHKFMYGINTVLSSLKSCEMFGRMGPL